MALDLSAAYPGKIVINPDNPNGTFKNRTSDVLKDGTPYEEKWPRDVWGFLSHGLKKMEIEPDNSEENINNSQYFQAFSSMFNSIPGVTKNLLLQLNLANPNYKVDIIADNAILKNSADLSFMANSINLTVDITIIGPNGLDTGSESTSTLYYIYLIYAPLSKTLAGLLSINGVTPSLPAGYTFYEPIGKVYNDSAGNFDDPVYLKSPDFKQYLGDGTDFTVSGTNWTTSKAVAVPYLTNGDIPAYRIKLNIYGTISVGVTSFTGTISGIVFNSDQTQSLNGYIADLANWQQDIRNIFANPGVGTFSVVSVTTGIRSIVLAGDVELDSKPDFMD